MLRSQILKPLFMTQSCPTNYIPIHLLSLRYSVVPPMPGRPSHPTFLISLVGVGLLPSSNNNTQFVITSSLCASFSKTIRQLSSLTPKAKPEVDPLTKIAQVEGS